MPRSSNLISDDLCLPEEEQGEAGEASTSFPARTLPVELLREQVSHVYRQLPTMQVASFIVALALAYSVRHAVAQENICAWLVMILAIVCSRIIAYYKFIRVSDGAFKGDYWKNIYIFLALVSGVIWGISAFIVFPGDNPTYIFLFVLVIASLSAATTVSHSAVRFGSTAWAAPALLIYAARCLSIGEEYGYVLSFLIILYFLTIYSYSETHRKTIAASMSLKFENLELLEELKKVNAILLHISAVDGLTGLANRRAFDEAMDREWWRSIREKSQIALIMIDIDYFKAYNDVYGHLAGDDCLKKVAQALSKAMRRPADLIARFGGEEFVAILPNTNTDGAMAIAEKMRKSVEDMGEQHSGSPTASFVTISAGVASVIPELGANFAEVISLADLALYNAKQSGRNIVKIVETT